MNFGTRRAREPRGRAHRPARPQHREPVAGAWDAPAAL